MLIPVLLKSLKATIDLLVASSNIGDPKTREPLRRRSGGRDNRYVNVLS
jgi:hypothetical protein